MMPQKDSQSENLVGDFDVSLFMARLIAGNGGTDAAQLLVTVLRGMRGSVSMTDLNAQNPAFVQLAQA